MIDTILPRGRLAPAGGAWLRTCWQRPVNVGMPIDPGNPWVPYPLSFETYRALAPRAGFSEPQLLGQHPSRFLKEFYSALAYRD